jgi:hypothetical protein
MALVLDDSTEAMQEDLVNAHKHFRTVLTCANLVSTINGEGQSKLVSEHQAEENSLRSLLSFVPAVLVRDIEVIAAIAHRPCPPTLASDSASGSFYVDIVQNAPLSDPSEHGELMGGHSGGSGFPSAITAVAKSFVADARQGDPYFPKGTTGPDCLVVKPGVSHLRFMGDLSEWERYIHQIP